MKLRLWPIIITITASTAVLFGGWFIYHSMALENPINGIVSGIHGVQRVSTNINNNDVTIDLKLNNDADLLDLYNTISKEVSNRNLKLNLASQTTPVLDKWWSSALFEVAQAMETKQYADIPTVLQSKASQISDLKVTSEMDETNVYVRLTQGQNSKYIILPRTPAKMGVWQ
jgi:multidrug efflux pump subunit AcrB